MTRIELTEIDAESSDLVTMVLDIEGTSLKREVGDGRVWRSGSTVQMLAAAFKVAVEGVAFTQVSRHRGTGGGLGDGEPLTTFGLVNAATSLGSRP